LRADYLSETEPMKPYWKRREDEANGQRRFQRTA
jgi:hypothetical protein